jgi:PAS domain S-box-containing protein
MPASPRRILVVEDEPGAATLQQRRLQRAGFEVQLADGVEPALRMLSQERVDLVVLDYRLGSTTGLDLNRRMKASGYDVPVILVSASISDDTIIEAIRAGVKDVVVKNLAYLDYLPEAVRSVLDQATAAGPAPEEPRGTTVLVVEDDPGVATLQRKQLLRAGYEVEVASSAEQAIATVRNRRVNLAILDLRLPDASGLELYERLKGEGLELPAILVTAFPDEAVAIRALRAGIRDFVPKSPDYLEYLPTAVDRVVAQVRVERKLVDSEMRLASIIGTAMDAIVMCDEQSRIVLFNRSAEQMFDCPASDALLRPVTDFIPDAGMPGASNSAPELSRRPMEIEGLTADGRRIPIEVSWSDVLVNGRRLFTVIARDISERKRNEAELREADRRKDVFLGMLAHELRNPLAAISTAGEVLHRTVDVPAQKLTQVIRRQTAALARMVDDLLDVSRVTLGKIRLTREPLLLGDVISRAIEGSRAAATRAGLQLEMHASAEAWLDGDATRLDQVFANLLTNAIKFTPAGGVIAVDASREGSDAIVRVRDTGVGIPPALLPRVFDLFVQGDTSLDRAKGGLGIGLALVRQLVRLHGGEVTAHSNGPGMGSEFVVRLPTTNAASSVEGAGVGSDSSSRGPLSVLVVDDQRDLADCVGLLVDTFGHRSEVVYSAAQALDVCHTRVPDVMLVDIGMPEMTGYDLARTVRGIPALAHTRLVALTGYGRDEDRARVLEAGFDMHLTKPVADDKLKDALDSLAVGR